MKLSRRLLAASGILMLLAATLHTIGNLSTPTDPYLIALEDRMRTFTFNGGMGMNPSMLDVHMLLVLTMTVTFAGLGLLNLALAASRELPDSLLRRVIWLNAFWVAAFTALSWVYHVPPPLISGVIIELPLIAALVAAK